VNNLTKEIQNVTVISSPLQ